MAGNPAYKRTRAERESAVKTLVGVSVMSRAQSPLDVFQGEWPCADLYSNSAVPVRLGRHLVPAGGTAT